MDWNLKITDMEGHTPEHSSVIVNFVAAIRYQLKNSTCYVYSDNVQYRFKDNQGNDVQALKDVNLDIKKGEFISLLGPSGCGKTTLLRIIADLQEPTTGTVRINGMTPREVRLQQKFGIVFQSLVLLDWRTVRKNMN